MRRRRKKTRKELTSTLLSNSIATRKSSESEFSFTLILVRQRYSQTRSSQQLVLSPTDPWLRSRPPTRPYPSQGPISVQPRDALATANLCYRHGLAVASGRAHKVHYGMSVRPRRSLVGSPRFESRTPFHGWATSSEGRRAVGVLPPGDGE